MSTGPLKRLDAWAEGRVTWAYRAGLGRWFWGGTFAFLALWPLDSGGGG